MLIPVSNYRHPPNFLYLFLLLVVVQVPLAKTEYSQQKKKKEKKLFTVVCSLIEKFKKFS